VSEQPASPAQVAGQRLLDVSDVALPQLYGYLLARCGTVPVAEDLTAETFLAAVDATRRDPSAQVSVPWLIGVARHKLVDHWRAKAREERGLRAVLSDPVLGDSEVSDPWDERLDALLAKDTLARLGPHHRAALTLRYLDDLPVPQVAQVLGRTLHATEALLVRAREAFRRTYTDLQSNPESTVSHSREEDDRG
jgi:RNA polymerase sigma-70 factor (ECF subfamily)